MSLLLEMTNITLPPKRCLLIEHCLEAWKHKK